MRYSWHMRHTIISEQNNKEIAVFAIRKAVRANALPTFGPVESVTLEPEVMATLVARGWTRPEAKRAYKAACVAILPK